MRSSLFIPNFLVRVVLSGILLVKVILYAIIEAKAKRRKMQVGTEHTMGNIDTTIHD